MAQLGDRLQELPVDDFHQDQVLGAFAARVGIQAGACQRQQTALSPDAAARPERWSGKTRCWTPVGSVWLNPERPDTGSEGHGSAGALPQKAGGGGPVAGPAERAACDKCRRQLL